MGNIQKLFEDAMENYASPFNVEERSVIESLVTINGHAAVFNPHSVSVSVTVASKLINDSGFIYCQNCNNPLFGKSTKMVFEYAIAGCSPGARIHAGTNLYVRVGSFPDRNLPLDVLWLS